MKKLILILATLIIFVSPLAAVKNDFYYNNNKCQLVAVTDLGKTITFENVKFTNSSGMKHIVVLNGIAYATKNDTVYKAYLRTANELLIYSHKKDRIAFSATRYVQNFMEKAILNGDYGDYYFLGGYVNGQFKPNENMMRK